MARPLPIPPDKRVALVDIETWLFPEPTMDALREDLAQQAVDPTVLQNLVQTAVETYDDMPSLTLLFENRLV